MIARVTLRLYSIPILVEFPTRHVDRARFKPPVRLMASASDLGSQKCVPCEGSNDIKVLDQPTAEAWLAKVSPTWNVVDQGGSLHLVSKLTTKNFLSALEICNRVGVVAEQEGHHPDLHIEAWNKLTIDLSTHSKNGLTENDFIMAAKIDAVDKEGLLRVPKKK